MNFNWTRDELQEILLMSKSWGRFGQFLDISRQEVDQLKKEHGLMVPVEFVRKLTLPEITKRVIELGSFEKAAAGWGVSASFLRQLLRKLQANGNGHHRQMPIHTVKDAMDRYLSVRLAARILRKEWGDEWTDAKVRERAKAEGFDLSLCIDGHSTGYNSSFGRKAEKMFSELRGDQIQEDWNKLYGPTAEIDFVDAELGRVNVKASKAFKRKSSKEEYWKFSTRGLAKADVVALMLYDGHGRELKYWTTKPALPLADVSCVIIDHLPTLFEQWGMKAYHANVPSSEDNRGPEPVPF